MRNEKVYVILEDAAITDTQVHGAHESSEWNANYGVVSISEMSRRMRDQSDRKGALASDVDVLWMLDERIEPLDGV
ncbi:hypothetical protein BEWA_002140 [Theileria equi strain WA]|uniref:Uncharacterized protein n=1 Tax=Theileria equi strain WA TaxID=1537102 RepID=L0AYY8_THEEQ|nr:hypothetical protein BEWA_002140 [Theileria equi strain WA]AFZ80807.1 hypothetical protein BEWA_002140 [Theileria equi strain WA]|eukprot:XP_004830473.1 hypothetical protein BEWA_002140 [Theileria equi strain WA]